MNQYRKIAVGAVASIGLALAVATAFAQPGSMAGGMGQMMGMHGGMSGSMQGPMGGQQLMTPQERESMREKMQNAKTPDERQALAASMRAEMEKRAKEKGVPLPEHRGHHSATGSDKAPATSGHQH